MTSQQYESVWSIPDRTGATDTKMKEQTEEKREREGERERRGDKKRGWCSQKAGGALSRTSEGHRDLHGSVLTNRIGFNQKR